MLSRSGNKIFKLKLLIPATILLILIVARITLPYVLLKKANAYLSEFSPIFYFHINDLETSLIRTTCRFQEVTGKLKSSNQQFLKIESFDTSIAWRLILKGRLQSDISTKKLDLLIIKENYFFSTLKQEVLKLKEKIGSLKIERADLNNASIAFENYKSLADGSSLKLSNINGRITNISPSEKSPLSYFNLTAILVDQTSELKMVGELNLLKRPPTWNLDAEVRNLQLAALNPYFKKHLPLTFTKGTVDIYSEVKSEDGKTEGYIKPFFKGIKIVANKDKVTKVKHFGVELLPVLIDLVLHQSKNKSFAANIEFEYDKKIKIKTSKRHRGQLNPGIDDRYQLTNVL
ncbi:MAG: DUF748 domain-containing protein [Bacteriovorax sp.]|nr:DUF748 domain-containing protein [Bacteriovorax sp.]